MIGFVSALSGRTARQQWQQETSKRAAYTDFESLQFPPYEPANEKFAAFHESQARIRSIFGGNRSGKTEAGAYELVKLCREHPGIEAWAGTVSYDAVREYVWPKLQKYLHEEEIDNIAWVNKAKKIPGIVYLRNDSFIVFKSYDQGREKFQGASVFAIWLDEECNEDIYDECLPRILDCGGYLFLTMTPLKGLSWPYMRIYQDMYNPNIQHWTVSLWENPYIAEEDKHTLVSIYSQDEKPKRVSGMFTRLTGAVWKELDETNNIILRFPIPRDWRRIRVIDFGYTNPFACLWMAMNADQEIYVYQEYYKAETLLKDHAATILDLDGDALKDGGVDRGIEATIADHDAQNREELKQYGITTKAAKKDVQLGIQTTNRRFKVKPNGRASLYIFNDLANTIREARTYHYPKKKANTNVDELPVKENDHCMDCLRYGVMYFDIGGTYKKPAAGEPRYRYTPPQHRAVERYRPIDRQI